MRAEQFNQHPFWFGRLDATVFLWKNSLARPAAIPYFRRVLREQSLPPDELAALNWARTRALLQYAYDCVPYYRRRFVSMGLHPADITAPEHYCQVPVLTKQDVRNHFDDLVSAEAKPGDLRLSTTGGSTGEPLKVYHQKKVVRSAMLWRVLLWWDLYPGLTYASVYRQQFVTLRQRMAHRLANWPGKRLHLNAADLTPTTMRRFLAELERHNPQLLHGYVGAVDELASFALAESIRIPAPKLVAVTSAPLTELQRLRIERAFDAPVCDQYGCCEVYWLAAQCPVRKGLHMLEDVRRIEFLDEHHRPVPRGEVGTVAVTDLENQYFPLIRYLVGDRSRALDVSCECGVTLPLMDHVHGRVTDLIRTPGGRKISGDFLTTLFDDYPDVVSQFQVYQAADLSVELRIVPNPWQTDGHTICAGVVQALKSRMGGEVPVNLVVCDRIPHDRGKQRYIISDAKEPQTACSDADPVCP